MSETYRMSSNADAYGDKVEIYKKFSKAEDYPATLGKLLASLLKGKKVLDVCCGNGKYASFLADHVLSYVGIDISERQIELAKDLCQEKNNVKFLVGDARSLPFKSEEFDCVISTWGICSIVPEDGKSKVLDEMFRVAKVRGFVYVAESDPFDDFNLIRSPEYHKKSLHVVRLLLEKNFLFKKKIDSYFYFDSLESGKELFEYFWGTEVSEKINSRRLNKEIILFEKNKL